MNERTRVAFIEKEIEVYQRYIDIIPTITKVLEDFDGKCVNKKLDTALAEALNNGKEKKGYAVRTSYGYNGDFLISIHIIDDRGVRELDSDSEYPNWYYVTNDKYTYRFPKEIFTITDSGNYRICAKEMALNCELDKSEIQDTIKTYKSNLKKIDAMIKDMRKIKSKMEKFKGKYNSHILEVMGLNFTLKYNGDYQYNNRYVL